MELLVCHQFNRLRKKKKKKQGELADKLVFAVNIVKKTQKPSDLITCDRTGTQAVRNDFHN